ncbi:MAG: tetratricopeptide repeat protein [Hyphomicrobiaceae bacterium]|nr:tetratricopeptide repeat protein [Hyphomicrobiaceae bacterium]
MTLLAMLTPYEVLGVTPDADPKTIRAAFRKAVKRHHPDVNASDAAAEQRLKQAIAAYETLKDARRRAAYDRAHRLRRRRDTRRRIATALATGMIGGISLWAVLVTTRPRETRLAAASAPSAVIVVAHQPGRAAGITFASAPGAGANRGASDAGRGPEPGAGPAQDPATAGDAAFYLTRGLSRSKASDFDGAIADFDAAIHLDPGNARAYRYRAAALSGLGERDRAIADYSLAVSLDPGDAGNVRERGAAWRRRGSLGRALADLDQAIRLGFTDASAYNERGLVWYAKGQRERAIADFNQAIKLDPRLAVAYVNRAIALRSKGDMAKAAADLEQAARLDPAMGPLSQQ